MGKDTISAQTWVEKYYPNSAASKATVDVDRSFGKNNDAPANINKAHKIIHQTPWQKKLHL